MSENMLSDWVRNLYKEIGPNSSAIMPLSMAAQALDLSRPSVHNWIKRGELRDVEIEGERYVRSYDVAKVLFMRSTDDGKVRSYLEAQAAKGIRSVWYSEVMGLIGIEDTSLTKDRTRIAHILGRILRKTYEEHGIFLPVLVHKKPNPASRKPSEPSEGFWELVEDILERRITDREAFVAEQTDLVLAHYA